MILSSHPQPRSQQRRSAARRLLVSALALVALTGSALVATAPTASATTTAEASTAGCASTLVQGPSRIGRIGGIAHPLVTAPAATAGCRNGSAVTSAVEAPYGGTPPLINHGGPVMATQSTADKVVVTPIFWEPSGYAMTSSYTSTITTYLDNLAADSGKVTSIFATMYQYAGSNGAINYKMQTGAPIVDTSAFPTAGCTTSTGSVYADSSGYTTCIDDDQVIAETNSVVAAGSLPRDFGHLYVMFLPKHVESCFNAGATNTSANACSINSSPSAAFCAYHSAFGASGTPTVYANMPFPIYTSATGYSCTKESLGGGIQSPNGDVDADVEVSPLSHEMAEAITDPFLNAWYDSSGNENGDDCAYIYGALSGSAGTFYNQTVNGTHYLTQEEFSNQAYVPDTSGCLQEIAAVTPTVTSLSSSTGPAAGGTHLTITGSGFPGASAVHFGATSAPFSVLDASHIDATIPAGAGTVDVTVSTSAGTSTATVLDQYTYAGSPAAPTVTTVSPTSGPTSGGTGITVTGTGFIAGSTVTVGGQTATGVVVGSGTQLTATTPAHTAGVADVVVTTAGGASATSPADQFTYVAPPPPTAPTVTGVTPASGPTAGGKVVTVTGSGFTTGATVTFGTGSGRSVTVASASTLTVTTPKHAKGTVDVSVTTSAGSSTLSASDRYTYLVHPAVTKISRSSGTHRGGATLTIRGTGFAKGATVLFGHASGLKVKVVSSTKIVVTTPRHPKGTVHVQVVTGGGRSTAHKVDRYRFR